MSYYGKPEEDYTAEDRQPPPQGGGFQQQRSALEEFRYAGGFRVAFGTHKGHTLDEIATYDSGNNPDAGLEWFDWILKQEWVNGRTREAIECFVAWEPVAQDMDRVREKLAKRDENRR